jgi:hypothetical protein
MTATPNTTLRELDQRVSDGIQVTLYWRPEDDRAIVAVADTKTDESFTLEVAPHHNALDVFHHPFAYAPDSVLRNPGGELAPTG